MKPEIPEVDAEITPNAVSLYQDGGTEDFPVLKAFQQYIDAEQDKARKRMISLAVFFGIFTIIVIAVFVTLLMYVSERNQQLNDRLVEFAMRERQQPAATTSAPVVVQPPQDSSALLALTAKLDEMQKKLADSQAKAERDAKEAAEHAKAAAIEAARPRGPSKEELEILKLKQQLEANKQAEAQRIALAKEKAKLEKEAKRQAELEDYRRKHYPELYEKPVAKPKRAVEKRYTEADFDDELENEEAPPPKKTKKSPSKSPSKIDQLLKELDDNQAISYFDEEDDDSKKSNSIPVDDKGNRSFSIPEE